MQRRRLVPAAAALICLGITSGCGSTRSHATKPSSSPSGLRGRAPARLVGTYKTTFSRHDLARAPKPSELPIGPWTLVIANTGGPNSTRALAFGEGDTDRASHRFTVTGARISIGCTDDQGLPSAGSQTYVWSMSGNTLTLKAASPPCNQGDANSQLILSGHRWNKQGAR